MSVVNPKPPSGPVTMARSWFPEEDITTFMKEAPEILRGRVSMGKWVKSFEKTAARVHGTPYAVATNSCTAALEIAMLALGVKPGDDVLVPVQTFIATGMAVFNIGARPIFCDIKRETLCLDPAELERRASDKVKAVILVHFAGLITPDFEEISAICSRNGWALIEDAAHAHGASFHGRPAGSLGDAGCFSYYPTKILTTGEGGMVVTGSKRVSDLCRSYQYRGQDLNRPGEVFVRPYGRNVRLPELSALLGVLQYGRLEEFLDRRKRIAAIYDRVLKEEHSLEVQFSGGATEHAYWLYTILLPMGMDRDLLKKRCMNNWNVSIDWSYYPPLHLMPVFQRLYQTHEGQLPVAEDALKRLVCLPVNPTISDEDADATIRCFLHEYRKLKANIGEK